MNATTRWRRWSIARAVVLALATALITTGMTAGTASAAPPKPASPSSTTPAPAPPTYTFTETSTQEVTLTVTETHTIGEYVGTGESTATASATASVTATDPGYWEAFFAAYFGAMAKAIEQANAKADAIARPVARQKAKAAAEALAAAGSTWTETQSQSATVTVHEVYTIGEFVGHGEETATATASATVTSTQPTFWEAYFAAYFGAIAKALENATAQADAQARPIAREKARAAAEALAAAGVEWTETSTQQYTATAQESVKVDRFTGYGEATVTSSATASVTAHEATFWEAFYAAYFGAMAKALDEAKAQAYTQAQDQALAQAEADAQAQYDAWAAAAPTACGPTITKADGTPWACTFADDFSGTDLDASKWTAMTTADSNFHYGDCLLGPDSPNVDVANGVLLLTTRKESAPFTCEDYDGPFTTSYTSGSVTTTGNFSQTFGRYEVRAAMPQTSGAGLHSAIWLWPDDPEKYGIWPGSGEIDIAEFYSIYPDRVVPAIHYNAIVPFSVRTNNTCLVTNPTAFHTYTLEWTAQRLTIGIDGKTCLTHEIGPLAPLLGSAPFDQPFNVNLTQVLGSATNALPVGTSLARPATMKVDYVRVWK